jgi:hypothetical protein
VNPGDDDALIAALSENARSVAKTDAADEPVAGAWHRLEARRGPRGRTLVRRVAWVSAGALTLVLGAMAGPGLWDSDCHLTFAVEGADARTDGYIPRVVGPEAQLRFSDGTEVGLDHGSRAWVVSTGPDGAQLRLEDGRAHFAVVHRPHAHWSVEAGPFVVLVTGTKFDVEWSGANDLLRVHLRNGVVTVGGPQTRGGVTLLPGQVLEARPDEGILRVQPAPADTAAPGVTSEARAARAAASSAVVTPAPLAPTYTPPPSPQAAARPSDSIARKPPAARPKALALVTASHGQAHIGGDWKEEIAHGDFEQILKDANSEGIELCLRSLDSDRLAALGDAARYAGQTALARRVLQAQRARFAGSSAAEEATFLLGRLAEDAHEPGSVALPWYDLYLAEAPTGAYAAEALGRRMLILGAQERGQRAREAARSYLEAHPRGAYVPQARQILEDPP